MALRNDVFDAERKSSGRGPEADIVKFAAEVSAKDLRADVEGTHGRDESRERRGGVALFREESRVDGASMNRSADSNIKTVTRPAEGGRCERALKVDLGRDGRDSRGSGVGDKARIGANEGEGTMLADGVGRGAASPTKGAAVETTRRADRGEAIVR